MSINELKIIYFYSVLHDALLTAELAAFRGRGTFAFRL